ncbi:MAG: sulfotransferase family protein [Thermodesulfobacteriota bacterium]
MTPHVHFSTVAAFRFAARRYLRLCRESLTRPTGAGTPTSKGKLLRLGLFLGFLPIWLTHWTCFFLDEFFFPGYRKVHIQKPLFVLGVPRSGTTFLHRTLAADAERMTTLATWEVFFAPTVTQRKFWTAMGAMDRQVGRPVGRLLEFAERKLFQGMDGVHEMALSDPEEDYLLLLPIFAAFILVLPFSQSETIWRLSKLDTDMPELEKRQILAFYRACLQKHLYVRGTDRRFLSKNASFASWVDALRETFPDAGFVFCFRDPEKAIPSLLGSLDLGGQLFEINLSEGEFPEKMTRMMRHYYRHLLSRNGTAVSVHMDDLKGDPIRTVERIYEHWNLPLSPEYRSRLMEIAEESRTYRSKANHIRPRALPDPGVLRDHFPDYYRWKRERAAS